MADRFGEPMDRVDGRAKVTGAAKYAYEQDVPGAAYAMLVTSSVAKGRVASIDSREAGRSPRVLMVLTHENSLKQAGLVRKNDKGSPGEALQVLQDDVIHFAGQPIAVVVAETYTHAHAAAKLLKIRYQEAEPAIDLDSRASSAYVPEKAGAAGDPSISNRGDFQSAFAQSDSRIQHTYRTPFQVHNPMEPHATIARWDGPDQLTIYDATQGVFNDRDRIAAAFGLDKNRVRVISPFLGGGFGSKGPTWSHVVLAAMAAKQVRRPVKLAVARPQMFGPVGLRSETRQDIAIGARKDGSIIALRNDTVSHTSTFGEFVETATLPARMLYQCPNNSTAQKLLRSNVGQTSYMRAPGEAPGTFALEVAMDEMAYELKMDPLAFRLKNYAETDPDKNKSWSSKSLRECYQKGAERFGWSKRSHEPRSMREADNLIGWGMATSVYPTRRSASSASVRLNADGTFSADAGSQDIGTGTYTIMTQIAARGLGVRPDQVRFRLGDTLMPRTPVSGGSQTAASTGSAVYLAAQALREKLVQMAVSDARSPLSGVSSQDVVFEDGRIFSQGDRSKGETFGQLLSRNAQTYVEAQADAKPGAEKEEYAMYAFGAQFAEVRVDPDLGMIKVSRMVGCFGAGQILNAKTARSQFIGGMIWGISFALFEEAQTDKRLARFVNNNLAEYHVPTHADIGEIDAIWVDEVDSHINPIGAKGIGEIGITGSAAAVANAVFHATGVRVRDVPITLDKILKT